MRDLQLAIRSARCRPLLASISVLTRALGADTVRDRVSAILLTLFAGGALQSCALPPRAVA